VFVECAVVMATEAVPAGNLLPVASHLCVWPETGLKQRAEAEQSGFEFRVCELTMINMILLKVLVIYHIFNISS